MHFFLPQRVHLLFSNGVPSSAPIYFYSEVGMLHFPAVTVSWEWVGVGGGGTIEGEGRLEGGRER